MLEAAGLGIAEPPTRCAEAPHDLAGVRPDSAADLVEIALVIVAAEHGVEGAALGDALGDVGVVVDRNTPSTDLEFAILAVQRDVRVAGGDLRKQKRVAVVVAKHGIDRLLEPFGKCVEAEGGAEIAEEQKVLAAVFADLGQCHFEVVEAVVDVTEDGDLHGARLAGLGH